MILLECVWRRPFIVETLLHANAQWSGISAEARLGDCSEHCGGFWVGGIGGGFFFWMGNKLIE